MAVFVIGRRYWRADIMGQCCLSASLGLPADPKHSTEGNILSNVLPGSGLGEGQRAPASVALCEITHSPQSGLYLLYVSMNAQEREKLISAFGRLLASGLDNDAIYDTDLLPFPKKLLFKALLSEFVVSPNDGWRTALCTALMALTQFQPGIGPKPIYRFGIGIADFAQLPPEQMFSTMATLPAKDPVWERHNNEFEKLSQLLEAFFEWERAQ